MGKKAFAYYRKSIERESEKSLQGQQEAIEEYAAANNIEIIKEFSEVASSATTERKKLEEMIEEVTSREDIDYILVHRFDRISREPMDMGWIFTLLKRSKVKTKLHSITEDNDYGDDPTKLMFILMKTYGAAIERLAVVDRLQSARKRKAEAGGFLGGTPPHGYRSINGTGKLEVNEEEVPLVKLVFNLKEKGFSMNQIAKELNQLGFTSRRGGKFHAQTVKRILKYENLYRGEYQDPGILEVNAELAKHYRRN